MRHYLLPFIALLFPLCVQAQANQPRIFKDSPRPEPRFATVPSKSMSECEKLTKEAENAWRRHHVLGCTTNTEKLIDSLVVKFNFDVSASDKEHLKKFAEDRLPKPSFTKDWADSQLNKVQDELIKLRSNLKPGDDKSYPRDFLAIKLLEEGVENLRQIRMYAYLKNQDHTGILLPGWYQSSAKVFYDPNLQDEARVSFFNQFSILTQFQTATIATEVARSHAGPVLLSLSALYSPEAAGADSASKLRAEELRFISAGGNVVLDASLPLFYAQVNKFYFQTSFGIRASANAQNFKSTTNNFAALISPALGINADFSTEDRVFQFTLASRIGYFGGTGAYYEAIFANNAAPKREFFFGQLNVGIKIKEKYSVYVQLPMFASEAMQNALMKIPASVALSFEFPEPTKK